MALSAATVWEVRTAGADTNGGGFVTGASGTDWSIFDNPQYSVTDGVTAGTTTITSATASFGTDVVGNIMYVAGGTGSVAAGWYQIATRVNITTVTVDRSTGLTAGTGVTLKIGGALASPGQLSANMNVAGMIGWIKAGTYTITSATANIAGGCFSNTNAIYVEGYNSSRGDLGTRPLLQISAISTFTIVSMTASRSACRNIEVDGVAATSSRGFTIRGIGFRLKADNCTNGGFTESTVATWISCQATGCSTQPAFGSGRYVDCIAYDNTVTGFNINASGYDAIRCISDSNSGASSDGFGHSASVTPGVLVNCVAYNNGRHGFNITEDSWLIENCIAETNAGTGILATGNAIELRNSAYYNNGTNVNIGTGKLTVNTSPVLGTASFFTNAASQDFSLNTTSGGGAAVRAAGFPGVLTVGGTGYLDIGALQHQDPAGGSGGGMRLAGIGGLASAG